MAIEKSIAQAPSFSNAEEVPEGLDPDAVESVEIAVVNPDAVAIETEDGGMVIDFNPQADELPYIWDVVSEYLVDTRVVRDVALNLPRVKGVDRNPGIIKL